MINIAVCDDQMAYMIQLVKKIKTICSKRFSDQIDCKAQDGFRSAEGVINYLEHNTINILFLDIEMEKMSGFELAAILNKRFPEMIIIFVSAYENHVYSAFEYSPFRFLRKTHIDEELEPALIAAVDKYLSDSKTTVFNTVSGPIKLRLNDILYFESAGNYVLIITKSGKNYKIRTTITQMNDCVKNDGFFMIHQTYIINMENVDHIDGSSFVIMKNKEKLPVSHRNASDFKKAFMSFTVGRFVN